MLLDRQVNIDRIRFNPYTLGLSARGVYVSERSGGSLFASAEEVYVSPGIRSFFGRALVIGSGSIKKPRLNLVRLKDGSYNFEDLLKARERPVRLSLNNIRVSDGSADFRDEAKGVLHTVRDMFIDIPFVSNTPHHADAYIHPRFSAAIDGAPYEIKGKTKPFTRSLETEIRIAAEEVDLASYASYLPPSAGVRVVEGVIDFALAIRYSQHADKPPSLVVSGELDIEKLVVNDGRDSPLMRLPRMAATLLETDVLARDVRIGRLTLSNPVLHVTRNGGGDFNLPPILSSVLTPGRPPEGGKAARPQVLVNIDHGALSGGKLVFVDHRTTGPFSMVVDAVNIRLDGFTNRKSEKAAFSFSAHSDAEEQVHAEGYFSLLPLTIHGQTTARSIAPDRYTPYYRGRMPFLLQGGRMNLSSRFNLKQSGNETHLSVSAFDVAFSNVGLREPGAWSPFLFVPILSLSDAEVDVPNKRLTIGELSTDKGVVRLYRSKSGQINVLRMARVIEKSARGAGIGGGKGETGWTLGVKQTRIRRYTLSIEESGTGRGAAMMKNLDLRMEGFTTEKGTQMQLALSAVIGSKGGLSLRGTAGIDPVFADTSTTLRNVDLALVQPYIPSGINLSIKGGTISSEGSLSLRSSGPGDITATYSGSLSAKDFDSTDTVTGEKFLSWRSLYIDSFSVGSNPFSLKTGGSTLTGCYLRSVLGEDGVFNIQRIFERGQIQQPLPAPQVAESRSGGRPSATLIVGSLTLDGGTVDFSDQFVKPSYSARFTQLSGTISGISSEAREPANIKIKGQVDDRAGVSIAGKVDLFGRGPLLDVAASANDPDTVSASTHPAHYFDYTGQTGGLTFNVTYLLADEKLRVDNREMTTPVIQLPVRLVLSVSRERHMAEVGPRS